VARALAIRRTEKNKMRSNWKSAVRILAMAALTIGFLPSLPAAANAHGKGNAMSAAQDPAEPHVQKPAPAHHAKPAAAQQSPDAEDGDGQSDDQNLTPQDKAFDQQQIENVRRQVYNEMMERMRDGRPRTDVEGMLGGTLVLIGFLGLVYGLTWILRTALEHRRWNKMMQAQSDSHAKLLDKFGSSQELLAYVESDAGKKFLETPVLETTSQRGIAVPYSRILWSVQVGIIAAVFGFGILMLRSKAPNSDSELGFQVFGTLVTTLGVGFLVSGGVSYVLARYMGLLAPAEEAKSRAALHS
jgi:hypothetical protein